MVNYKLFKLLKETFSAIILVCCHSSLY